MVGRVWMGCYRMWRLIVCLGGCLGVWFDFWMVCGIGGCVFCCWMMGYWGLFFWFD